MSGRRAMERNEPIQVRFVDNVRPGVTQEVVHSIQPSSSAWTRYLLTKAEIDAYDEAEGLPVVERLRTVAKFEVAAVTGANDYFSVDQETVEEYDLGPWTVPLLPRIRHAPGLRFTECDYKLAGDGGARVHLLDFSSERPDPELYERVNEYLELGLDRELHRRYKCRIRTPWYRVPHIRAAELMMSKRSHLYPRVVLNEVGAVTTDTIYRARYNGTGEKEDLVATFHNSLTLLSAELEGRSFGGGVLELVPSEVGRLRIPIVQGPGLELERLDKLAREGAENDLVEETNQVLARLDVGLDEDLLGRLRAARLSLTRRRLERNLAS